MCPIFIAELLERELEDAGQGRLLQLPHAQQRQQDQHPPRHQDTCQSWHGQEVKQKSSNKLADFLLAYEEIIRQNVHTIHLSTELMHMYFFTCTKFVN